NKLLSAYKEIMNMAV
ncbi:flagellar hook-basal body complex protein FliE, partial [uncultured Cobetia sp.]